MHTSLPMFCQTQLVLQPSDSMCLCVTCGACKASNGGTDSRDGLYRFQAGNVGGLVSTWAFLPKDRPDYKIGNGINLAVGAIIFITASLLYLWAIRDNRRRDQRDTKAELAKYSDSEISDLDWKHPVSRSTPSDNSMH